LQVVVEVMVVPSAVLQDEVLKGVYFGSPRRVQWANVSRIIV
jgi:hypothetical protein